MNRIILLALCTLILSSCKTSSDVVNGGWIQKRKYTSGWHVEHRSSPRNTDKAEQVPAQQPESPESEATCSLNETTPIFATEQSNDQERSPVILEKAQDLDKRISARVQSPMHRLYTKIMADDLAAEEETADSEAYSQGLKKKKRKEKWEPITMWASFCVALSTWFTGIPLDLPFVAIPLAAAGLILGVVGLFSLKKSKKRNRTRCVLIALFSILMIVLAASPAI